MVVIGRRPVPNRPAEVNFIGRRQHADRCATEAADQSTGARRTSQ
jgi:hypothetical protein